MLTPKIKITNVPNNPRYKIESHISIENLNEIIKLAKNKEEINKIHPLLPYAIMIMEDREDYGINEVSYIIEPEVEKTRNKLRSKSKELGVPTYIIDYAAQEKFFSLFNPKAPYKYINSIKKEWEETETRERNLGNERKMDKIVWDNMMKRLNEAISDLKVKILKSSKNIVKDAPYVDKLLQSKLFWDEVHKTMDKIETERFARSNEENFVNELNYKLKRSPYKDNAKKIQYYNGYDYRRDAKYVGSEDPRYGKAALLLADRLKEGVNLVRTLRQKGIPENKIVNLLPVNHKENFEFYKILIENGY